MSSDRFRSKLRNLLWENADLEQNNSFRANCKSACAGLQSPHGISDMKELVSMIEIKNEEGLVVYRHEGYSLRGAKLTGCALERVNLYEMNLRSTAFSKCDLRNARISYIVQETLFTTVFGWMDESVRFSGPTFHECCLTGANFSGSDLRGASFTKSDLRGAMFCVANLLGVDFRHCDLRDADFTRLTLSADSATGLGKSFACDWSNMERVSMAEVFGRHAFFVNSVLSDADLSGSDFSNARFSDSEIVNANMANTCFREANFSGAKLNNADLSNADLSGADLSGADLTNAVLDGARLNDVKFNRDTKWPEGVEPK